MVGFRRLQAAVLAACLSGGALFAGTPANPEAPKIRSALQHLKWRNIGPANMSGRVTDVEGVAGDPGRVLVASASGGLWKTVNAGVTWKPIFDDQSVISIGDIAIDPKNPDVVWVGTGEANPRNSVSIGDGVYKSTDGGETWTKTGLTDNRHVSRILINPLDTDTVYVAGLGHAFGPNSERGVFKTVDGGKTWEKVLYLDDRHGASDLEMDPVNPNILYAALWRFERKPWGFTSGGEEGGVFKSTDAGATWIKLSEGLPKLMGRIAVKAAPSKPETVYVLAESKEGTLFRSDDRGGEFVKVNDANDIVGRGFYFTQLRIDPRDENRVYAVAGQLRVSIDGGKTFKRISRKTHVDYHALWIDPADPDRIWQGQDGGVAVSLDRGEHWETVGNLPVGQFYQIWGDNRLPFYSISGGLQDNGTWIGPSRTRDRAGIINDDWRMFSFGDGFFSIAHPEDPDLLLSESQGGNLYLTNHRNGEQQLVTPRPEVGCCGPASRFPYRFHWNAPLALSEHDPDTVYFGGNVVFKSTDFGRSWEQISPDLTTNDPEKQKDGGGPVWYENTVAEFHCTLISLAESPVRAGVVWAGSDDGNLQLSRDGGQNWVNLTPNVAGLPPNSPVSHIEPSRRDADTAYAAFDRHMLDDYRGYVYKTVDGGKTWSDVSGGLPDLAYVWVVREDPVNPNLIYAGTEVGLFASYQGGGNWVRLGLKNLPTVAVHDIRVHGRDNDLILGTHGRAVWVFDDATPIQRLDSAILDSDAALFDIRPGLRHSTTFSRYGIGDEAFTAKNPPYGALISYYLKDKLAEDAPLKLEILDGSGKVVRSLMKLSRLAGVQRVAWDLDYDPPPPRKPEDDEDEEENEFGGGPAGARALPGLYTARLTAGETVMEKPVRVVLDPTVDGSRADLPRIFEIESEAVRMESEINLALRSLDGLKEQLDALSQRLSNAGNESDGPSEKIKRALAEIEMLQDTLAKPEKARSIAEPPRLVDQISSLFDSVNDSNWRPTAAQERFLEELGKEFKAAMTPVREFLNETAPRLRRELEEAGVPLLSMPSKEAR